jgi:hypothetical protein
MRDYNRKDITPGQLEKAKTLIDEFEEEEPDIDEVINRVESKIRELEKEIGIPEEERLGSGGMA